MATGTQPTAQAEAGTIQAAWDRKLARSNYREQASRFFADLGEHAGQIPAHYPPFTEEHAEVLALLGYLG